MDNQDRPEPNKKVKIVFEEIDTEDPDIKGCRVYPEYDGRQLNIGMLSTDDVTIAEHWSIEILEFIRAQLVAKAGDTIEAPKKEDMN